MLKFTLIGTRGAVQFQASSGWPICQWLAQRVSVNTLIGPSFIHLSTGHAQCVGHHWSDHWSLHHCFLHHFPNFLIGPRSAVRFQANTRWHICQWLAPGVCITRKGQHVYCCLVYVVALTQSHIPDVCFLVQHTLYPHQGPVSFTTPHNALQQVWSMVAAWPCGK